MRSDHALHDPQKTIWGYFPGCDTEKAEMEPGLTSSIRIGNNGFKK